MTAVKSPAFWAQLVLVILAAAGVKDPHIAAAAKDAAVAGAVLVSTVWQVQHHRTVRNGQDNAAAVALAAARAPAGAPTVTDGHVVAPTAL